MTDLEYEEARRGWVRWYGQPEYGGWTRDTRDGRQKPQQVIEEERKEREKEINVKS